MLYVNGSLVVPVIAPEHASVVVAVGTVALHSALTSTNTGTTGAVISFIVITWDALDVLPH